MSELRVDNIVSQDGSAAPVYSQGVIVGSGKTFTVRGDVDFQSGANVSGAVTFSSLNIASGFDVSGVITATTFNGNVSAGLITATQFTGNINGNATGLAGTPNITVGDVSAQDVQVGGALTVTGDLTVNGTTTTIDTATLSIEDANIGIGSVSNPSNTTADGAGITIFAGSDEDKTITWERDTGCFEFSDPCKFNGVVEKISAGTTYMSGSDMVLELNVRTGTVFTHTGTTDVGIVSFTGMPADTGVANGTSVTVIHTSAGAANTTTAAAFGKNCTVVGYEDGSAVTGISTVAFVGAGTSITMSSTSGDRDFVSFFIQYTGGTNTDATSYKVYATKNGGFRQV